MRTAVAVLAMVVAGVGTAGALTGPAAATAPPAPPATAASATAPAARIVTLITGDRLQVSPDGRSAGRLRTPGRDGIALVSEFAGGRLRVVPADAVPLLHQGRLDPRLFDVTGLLAAGYDESRGDLPLIVTSDDRAAVIAAAGGGPARDLGAIDSAAVRVSTSAVAAFWRRLSTGDLRTAYRKVWLDGVAQLDIDVSVPLVGAPAAWAEGLSGGSVPVAVLDTGVDTDHPDLAGAIAENVDFTTAGDGVDRTGHGTHVASIIAGSGAASGGRFRGMAPDVRLYSAKVCESSRCTESSVLAGMQWAARDRGVKVVNLSLGHSDEPGTDLLEEAVGTLTDTFGTLFVVAAGNDGAAVTSPASADAAVAVGATSTDDEVAGFSGHGRRDGAGGPKPDIVAPGVDITAARSGDSPLAGRAYATLSGTSMAAPHVAGAAAILAQRRPEWTPAQLKAALMSSATRLDGSAVDRAGAGRLDVANAVAAPVLAAPAGLTFAQPGVRTVTLHNATGTPVTLELTTSSAAFTVADRSVTVPARGDVAVRVTARPGADATTGWLTARGDDVSVHAVLSTAPRTYAVRVRFTDRAGAPTDRALGSVYGPDGTARPIGADGVVRVPAGTYTVDGKVFESRGGVTVLHRPAVVVAGDTTVALDARSGRPVTVAPPRPGLTPVYAQVAVTTASGVTTAVQDDTFAEMTTAQLGGSANGVRTDVAAGFVAPGALYSLAWSVPDRFPTGFSRSVQPSELSSTHAEFGASQPGTTGLLTRFTAGGGFASAFGLPFDRTEYLSRGSWSSVFTELAHSETARGRPIRVMAAGPPDPAAPAERWNLGVYGPAFPPPTPWRNGISRTGDTVLANPAWSTEAEHGGPPPGPVTVSGNRISVAGTTWVYAGRRTDRRTLLPLSAVRFEPLSATVLGFRVQHQVPGTRTTAVHLEVSYDQGQTWTTPLYSRVGDTGVAVLRPGAGEVSLRVTATNSAGAEVAQTLLRAYRR